MQLPHWGEAVGEVMGGASEDVEPGLWNSTVSLWESYTWAASAAGMRQREQRVNCTLATINLTCDTGWLPTVTKQTTKLKNKVIQKFTGFTVIPPRLHETATIGFHGTTF